MLHKNVVVGDNHYIQNWEVANSTARNAISTSGTDIGKVCRQLDTAEFWILTATGWKNLTNGSTSDLALKRAIISQNKLRAASCYNAVTAILAWKNYK